MFESLFLEAYRELATQAVWNSDDKPSSRAWVEWRAGMTAIGEITKIFST